MGKSRPLISVFIVPVLSLLFLLFAQLTLGIRGDQVFLVVLVNACYYISPGSRRLIIALTIFIVYWIIFDSMKLWPNWRFHDVDIAPLYNLEKKLFGIHSGGSLLTPNEFFAQHTSTFIDVLCGIFYLSWVPLPLIFAIYLYFTRKDLFLRFSLAFFIVNCVGFIIYYLHPAAPPWYVHDHGMLLDINTKGSAAGLLRVDQFFGIHLFEGIYSKGSNVFAAMPSLHASYPLIGLIYALKQRARLFKILFAVFMPGIWFAAIYLSHHYILDVLAGISCGLIGIFILEKVFMRTGWFKLFLGNYEKIISKQPQ